MIKLLWMPPWKYLKSLNNFVEPEQLATLKISETILRDCNNKFISVCIKFCIKNHNKMNKVSY